MKRSVENWSVEQLYKERARISFPEYQRQDNLWSDEKKALLIDSILKNIDIPKLYFNKTKKDTYEVVDGQQRLWAIWQFLGGEYSLAVNGKRHKFAELGPSQRDSIRSFELQVSVLEDADDEYLRELFIRLQLGLLLITGEKLHAASGCMKEFVFRKLVSFKFIQNIGIPSRRFAKETLSAQICINSFSREKLGSFSRTRYEDLQHFFREYENPQGKDLAYFTEKTKKICGVMDRLGECMDTRAKELRSRSYILSVYLLFEEILGTQNNLSSMEQKEFVSFALCLWKRLRQEVNAGFDRKNKELYTLETFLSSAPGEKYQIERRHEKMRDYFAYFKNHKKIKGD